MQSFNTVEMAHRVARKLVQPGDLCIDATAGRGNDTAFLCGLVGETGRVLAFDIQQEAVASTQALLEKRGLAHIARVLHDSHANMSDYARPQTVRCITFNFGWLPGGDHHIFTQPDTSIAALRQGMELLCPGGAICMCIYYGRESGYEERDRLLEFLETVDSEGYTALVTRFANRPNNPPIPAFIFKHI